MPSNYCVHRKDRNREGGGVLIAVRSEMQSTVNNELDTDCEILWAKIMTEDKRNLHVCAYYRPKTSDIESLDKFETSLRRAASTDSRIVIAGVSLSVWLCVIREHLFKSNISQSLAAFLFNNHIMRTFRRADIGFHDLCLLNFYLLHWCIVFEVQ